MAGPVEVLRAEDLAPNSVTALQVRGRRVAVVQCESGLYALDDECSHQGGPLGEDDLAGVCARRCPWHGARFDVRTGEVLDGPAARPVRTYPVTVEDGARRDARQFRPVQTRRVRDVAVRLRRSRSLRRGVAR